MQLLQINGFAKKLFMRILGCILFNLILVSSVIGQKQLDPYRAHKKGLKVLSALVDRYASLIPCDDTASNCQIYTSQYVKTVTDYANRDSLLLDSLSRQTYNRFVNDLCEQSENALNKLIGDCKESPEWNKIEHLSKAILKLKKPYDHYGRKVIKRNTLEVMENISQNQEGTRIVSLICVDQTGEATHAELLPETTALIEENKREAILEAIKGYKVQPDFSTEEECWKLTIRINKINRHSINLDWPYDFD